MGRFTTTMAIATLAGSALGQTATPFTEDFENGLSNWDARTPLVASLGTEGSNSFARITGDVSGGSFGASTFFGGDAGTNFSDGNLSGDFLSGGIDTLSFDVRHDSSAPLTFSLRIATQGNFPAFLALGFAPVAASSEFTTVSFDISPDNPALIPEAGTIAGILSDVTAIQFLVGLPDGVSEVQGVTIDVDNVSAVPAPAGATALLAAGGLVARRRRRA